MYKLSHSCFIAKRYLIYRKPLRGIACNRLIASTKKILFYFPYAEIFNISILIRGVKNKSLKVIMICVCSGENLLQSNKNRDKKWRLVKLLGQTIENLPKFTKIQPFVGQKKKRTNSNIQKYRHGYSTEQITKL
ncbi:hypothetical protein BpHYR1_052111 [Brachionus plicatilis]|uniref:Uncharacterized protein n=1 Tax=Brachionus plicatilis TaxID=10195 RepID=A0A3M7RQ21_BRAPC|nr:hypothetical protein BpHYR1_052111 [Brachionus plicatilis]